MANPVSLQRRGILPSKSVAVRLHDYDLVRAGVSSPRHL